MEVIKISVDSRIHIDYGLAYPVTYIFSIPRGISNLKVYKRYKMVQPEVQMPERTSGNFFNGIEGVRFDYLNCKVYISVAFSEISDEIYLKAADTAGSVIDLNFQGISKYYDDRNAAVIATGDDWDGYPANNEGFKIACDALSGRKIWFTPGIITGGTRKYNWPPVVWKDVQSKVDAGFIDVASHSQEHLGVIYPLRYTGVHAGSDNNHGILMESGRRFYQGYFAYLMKTLISIARNIKAKQCPICLTPRMHNLSGWRIENKTDGSFCFIKSNTSRTIHCADGLSGGRRNCWRKGDVYLIDRYDEEIGGSSKEILENLNMPYKRGNHQYIYAWIEPSGYSDEVVRKKLGEYKYLADRDTSLDNGFAPWDVTSGLYQRIGFSMRLEESGFFIPPNIRLSIANSKFDAVVGSSGIYHIIMHPKLVDWSDGSWVLKHLDYIKERKNLWYVGFGHLYLYHFTAEKVRIEKIRMSAPSKAL